MATTLALAMRASMSASGVVSGANQAAGAMDKMGRQAQKTARDVSVLKNIAIGAVVAKGITMAADAFVSAGRAALSYASNVASAVDAMNDLAQRTGMGVEALQALQMAGRLSGVDDVTGAVQKLAVAIGQAADSGNTDAFTKLGINFAELQAMAPEEQFRAVQAAIAALPTPAERAAAAVAIFGKAGVELLPLMNENLKEIEERMRRLGAVVGADQVEAIDEMNDSLAMVRAMFDGIIGQVVGNLAPIVTALSEELMALVESFNSASGSGGEGIANVITEALLDIAEYFAGIFDYAYANFGDFGSTLTAAGEVFKFVGNVFVAVGEVFRAAFNALQIWGNGFLGAIGMAIEKIGGMFSEAARVFGRELQASADAAITQNFAEMQDAASNAYEAGQRAVFGEEPSAPSQGPAGRAVAGARQRLTPEAKAEREAARKAKEAEAKAAREAAAAKAKAEKEAAEAKRRQEEAAKKAAAVQEKIDAKQENIDKIGQERAEALSGKNNEALKANDIRSGEGMAQFLALATGREDPAIAEYRKQTQKLEELKAELRALQQQQVEILGAAA